MLTNKALIEQDASNYLPTFKRMPIVIEKGMGSKVWDVEGNEYLDTFAGIAVNNVGHAHPKVVSAIQKQAAALVHVSNIYGNIPQVDLSQKLIDLSGLDRIFFSNSGAESNEGAIKIARKYAHSIGRGGQIISMTNCFHGRTLGTIASGKKVYQDGFEPIPSGYVQIPFNDLDALKKEASNETAAVIIEPVQGEGGIHPTTPTFMKELRQFCTDNNIVLIFDEIQCGIGRTGYMFAKDYYGVQPDIMTLAKGLGGGVPIGAFLAKEKICGALKPGDHGTTFGGNPLVCAAALAVLEVIEEEKLVEAAQEKGEWLIERIKALDFDSIKEVRGRGLMIGIELDFEAKPLTLEFLKHGILANATAVNVLRIAPALNISYEELEFYLSKLEFVLSSKQTLSNA